MRVREVPRSVPGNSPVGTRRGQSIGSEGIKSAQTRRLYKFGLFEADSDQGALSRRMYP